MTGFPISAAAALAKPRTVGVVAAILVGVLPIVLLLFNLLVLNVLLHGRICEFLNLIEEFLVLRGLLWRIVQVFEQAGKAHKIIANC